MAGREPGGRLEPDTVDAEVAWLTDALQQLEDGDGNPVVRDVLRADDLYPGSCRDRLPDLFVRWHRRPAMADTLRSPLIGEVSRPYQGARTGDHHPRGRLLRLGPAATSTEATAEPLSAPAVGALLRDALFA